MRVEDLRFLTRAPLSGLRGVSALGTDAPLISEVIVHEDEWANRENDPHLVIDMLASDYDNFLECGYFLETEIPPLCKAITDLNWFHGVVCNAGHLSVAQRFGFDAGSLAPYRDALVRIEAEPFVELIDRFAACLAKAPPEISDAADDDRLTAELRALDDAYYALDRGGRGGEAQDQLFRYMNKTLERSPDLEILPREQAKARLKRLWARNDRRPFRALMGGALRDNRCDPIDDPSHPDFVEAVRHGAALRPPLDVRRLLGAYGPADRRTLYAQTALGPVRIEATRKRLLIVHESGDVLLDRKRGWLF